MAHYQVAAQFPINADSTDDEGMGQSTTSSLLSSIASDIKRGKEENGRIYAAHGKHEYGLPIDEREFDRMNMNHLKYTMLQGDRLFFAPIGKDPQHILDLGTGSGCWAIDVADEYPSASVIGTDIAPIQPQWVPANCEFQIDDMEAEWTFEPDTFDFIHLRDLYHAVRDWKRLVQQCHTHLRPGGYVEFGCVYPVAKCDDGTLPRDSAYVEMLDLFNEIGAKMLAEPAAPERFADWLRDEGFDDVQQVVLRIPCSPWPKDARLKKVGAYELINVIEGSEAFFSRGWQQLGKTKEMMQEMIERMRQELLMNKYHAYVSFFITYGRKPVDAPTSEPVPQTSEVAVDVAQSDGLRHQTE